MIRRLALTAAVMCALLAAGCSDSDERAVKLDGSPRIPDDEGIATVLTRERIQLDGKRSYNVDPGFISFSTYTGEIEQMIDRRGQYVQLGVRDGKAVWMAGVAAVIRAPEPAVYYIGRLKDVDGERLVFADGTVLRKAKALKAPKPGAGRVRVRIDPAQHRVIEAVAS